MGSVMKPIPFPQLINRIQSEYKNTGSVFGIRKEKFFRPSSCNFDFFDKKTSAPVGVSAGPFTQLAQNILAVYLAGARIITLKTVQTMDGEELRKALAKPGISALPESYNVEWSTELTVTQAMDEYIKAWFLCHIFAVEFNISEKTDVIFSMSTGYSLEGIRSKKMDDFIEGMKDARNTEIWQRCYEQTSAVISSFSNFTKADLEAVSPEVSNRMIISTFYNCPKDEIEKIVIYFLGQKTLHTLIKCNPTLLGYERCRELLDEMGYKHISFTDNCFNSDIQLKDAVRVLRHMKLLAAKIHLGFGVSLTNTLPVEIKKNEFTGKEMYLSGRALFPLSIHTAEKIAESSHAEIPIFYTGGVDFFNIKEILETGIRPVTMVTNLLKSGGPERLQQLARIAEKIEPNNRGINIRALNTLCVNVLKQNRYKKESRSLAEKKTFGELPVFDCVKTPCTAGCPLNMKIPDFLSAVSAENYEEAFRIMANDNTALSVTANICNHECQSNCRRNNYDDPLQIRNAELLAVNHAQETFIQSLAKPDLKTRDCAAVIGAGPAGIAAAVFLRRNGVAVTVYEKRDKPFGAVQYLIPSFKVSDEAIFNDYQIAVKTGVDFVFNAPENFSITELKKKHKFIVIACGLWKNRDSVLLKGQEELLDSVKFLEESKKTGYSLNLGKKVAVIGGANAAVNCARAAKRNKGVDSVTIIYRRTKEYMRADAQEIEQALAEKINILELLSPDSLEDGLLVCDVNSPQFDRFDSHMLTSTGEKQKLHFDTVINAAGVKIDAGLFTHNNIHLDGHLPVTNGNLESSVSGVYIAGSCRTGCGKTANAAADGKIAAFNILKKLKIEPDFSIEPAACSQTNGKDAAVESALQKKGVIQEQTNDNKDAQRCLSCNVLCEICVDVCPNRANIAVLQETKPQKRQIIHIDSMCNNCGNCAVFCPYDGKPYAGKITVFYDKEDFDESENPGFYKTGKTFFIRFENKTVVKYSQGEDSIPAQWVSLLKTLSGKYGYLFPPA